MKNHLFSILLLAACFTAGAQNTDYITRNNIPYYPESVNRTDQYISERCVLDIYYPRHLEGYPAVVWFHGGGLTGGNKEIPQSLKEKELAVVAVNYRLYPKIKAPAYIEDAAAAVAWVFSSIAGFGGDPDLIFVSGHSAGGYLTSMVGHPDTRLFELDGYGHGMTEPAFPLLLSEVNRIVAVKKSEDLP